MNFEDFAYRKYSKPGKCAVHKNWHRVGLIPVSSLLDEGLPGDVCHEYCIDCGKKLGGGAFLPKLQPNKVGGVQTWP